MANRSAVEFVSPSSRETPHLSTPTLDHRLAALHNYWLSLQPEPGLLPGRQHFDPLAVFALLPWIWLVDVHRNPLRFRYRLVGTAHVQFQGVDPTGDWFDEAHPDFAASPAFTQFQAVAERGDVAFHRGMPAYTPKRHFMTVERLVLPLAGNGKDVDILLGITVTDPREGPRNRVNAAMPRLMRPGFLRQGSQRAAAPQKE